MTCESSIHNVVMMNVEQIEKTPCLPSRVNQKGLCECFCICECHMHVFFCV